MVARKLLVVALAATLLIGGVAATGAASVQDAQPDDQDDRTPGDAGPPDNSTQYEDGAADRGNGSAADRGNGSAPDDVGPDAERGPPVDMPANVPEHVTQIHQTINDYLSGDVDHLGNALSEFLGDDAGEDDAAENESEENESDDADAEEAEATEDDETDDADSDDDADADGADAEESEDDADDADADA